MRDRARNSIRGRKAQQAGDALETWLGTCDDPISQHGIARRLGILAHIDKIDPPAEVRNGRVEFGEKTVADYVGMLDGGAARYLAVEAKSTLKEYLSRAEVSKKQQAHLETVARGGGLALLAVEFRGELSAGMRMRIALLPHGAAEEMYRANYRRYCAPWQSIVWQVLRTAESVSEESLWDSSALITGECYLEKFQTRGVPSSALRVRNYPRE